MLHKCIDHSLGRLPLPQRENGFRSGYFWLRKTLFALSCLPRIKTFAMSSLDQCYLRSAWFKSFASLKVKPRRTLNNLQTSDLLFGHLLCSFWQIYSSILFSGVRSHRHDNPICFYFAYVFKMYRTTIYGQTDGIDWSK